MLLVSQPEAFALPCTSKTSNAEAHADMYKDTPRYRAYVLTRERNSCGIYHYIHTERHLQLLQSRLVHGVCEVPGCQDETHVNAFQYVIVPTPSGTWRANGVSSEAKLQLSIEKTKYFSVNLRM